MLVVLLSLARTSCNILVLDLEYIDIKNHKGVLG